MRKKNSSRSDWMCNIFSYIIYDGMFWVWWLPVCSSHRIDRALDTHTPNERKSESFGKANILLMLTKILSRDYYQNESIKWLEKNVNSDTRLVLRRHTLANVHQICSKNVLKRGNFSTFQFWKHEPASINKLQIGVSRFFAFVPLQHVE